MDESGWMCMKVDEVNEIGWKDENGWSGWKLMKVDESLLNGWKWIKDDESGWKLMKADAVRCPDGNFCVIVPFPI